MRQRSTWNKDRQAATSRTADIYTMNQDHPQPTPTDYENGDPDAWAETPTKNEYVEATYDGDSEARNEMNFAEFAPSTFDHKDSDKWGPGSPGKYDNQRGMTASSRKAAAVERISRALLRTANTGLIEEQAIDLMSLPDTAIIASLKRLEAVSPNALKKEQKLRRSYSCCKLAASMIPPRESFASAEKYDAHIEKVARSFAALDDLSLKSIISSVVASRKDVVASDDDEDDKESDTAASSSDDMDDKDEADTAAAPAPADTAAAPPPVPAETATAPEETPVPDPADTATAPPMEVAEEGCMEDVVDTGCMSGDDMAMLDSMLQTPPAPATPMDPAAMPAAPAPLTDLFASDKSDSTPSVASSSDPLDIAFGEDEGFEGSDRVASDPGELDSVFNDEPDVVAQREIRAAAEDQQSRELGYKDPVRVASGAKKLGNINRPQEQGSGDLDALWA